MSEAKKLHLDIRLAYAREEETRRDWQRYVDYYNKDKYHTGVSSDDRVKVSIIYTYVRTLEAGLYYRNPHIYINPRSERDRRDVESLEKLINEEWKDSKIDVEIKRCIRDNILCGTGWIKTGYIGTDRKTMLGAGQLHSSLRAKRLYSIRVSPFDMFVDVEARPGSSRFVAQRFYRTLAEIKADPKLDNVDIEPGSMKSINHQHGQPTLLDLTSDYNEHFYRVEMFEYWDRQKEEYYIIATGSDKILFKDKFPKWGIPFSTLTMEEGFDQFYGLSPISKIESEAKELNATRTQRLNHRKAMKSIILYDPDLLSSSDVTKITQSDGMSWVPVKGLSTRLEGGSGRAWVPLDSPSIPADLYRTEDIIRQSVRETLALPEYNMGRSVAGVRTAYEASVIEQSMGRRTDDKVGYINDFCREIASKQLDIITNKYKDNIEVPYIEEDTGDTAFASVVGSQYKGDYNVDINVAEGVPDNALIRREQALRFFEIFAPHPNYDETILAKELFEAFGKRNFGKVYKPDQISAGAPGTPNTGYGIPGGQPSEAGSPEGVEPTREMITANMGRALGGR